MDLNVMISTIFCMSAVIFEKCISDDLLYNIQILNYEMITMNKYDDMYGEMIYQI